MEFTSVSSFVSPRPATRIPNFNPSPALGGYANAPGFSSRVCFAGNSNSSIVLTLILSVVTPYLSLNTYARVSIVRLNEPVVIVAAHFPSRWSSGCLHWPWLSASLVPLSLFLGRSLFYIDFFCLCFFKRSAWTAFFRPFLCVFLSKRCEKSRGMQAC